MSTIGIAYQAGLGLEPVTSACRDYEFFMPLQDRAEHMPMEGLGKWYGVVFQRQVRTEKNYCGENESKNIGQTANVRKQFFPDHTLPYYNVLMTTCLKYIQLLILALS